MKRTNLEFTRSKPNRGNGAAQSWRGEQSTPARASEVQIRMGELALPTYMPAAPDKNPMFLEKRVYQGSSGQVYPLPFTDRIAEKPLDRLWKAVWIENEYLRALVLPEIGGRVHLLQDKATGLDLIYNQGVIKPALVGLAGPWISGGIEFNWPQHHRPATFLPVDVEIQEHADGSKTIWCSDHDPMSRMKGMHGICLHPGRACLELKVRAYNRTPFVQTFLWWANVAVRVHEAYQSFFPPDVYYVADHARRSMSEYPLCHGRYYGVNYGERGRQGIPENEMPAQFVPPHCRTRLPPSQRASKAPAYGANDLSFYANIPVPTSYMCMGSREDFFGGYDYATRAGLVHYANHHIAPGKKQWTWGNHDFGYAWDRNLTDPDPQGEYAPYIEIMAGVYTDNQPDFSYLQPGETKSWSQYWYPIHQIGPAQKANPDAALSMRVEGRQLRLGVAATRKLPQAKVTVEARGRALASFARELSPAHPLVELVALPAGVKEQELSVRVTDERGEAVLCYEPQPRPESKVPAAATEPPAPVTIPSADELYVTGLHLEQYRHATRCPTLYWLEALRRDPLDARCNNAMGLWHLKRGEFKQAEDYFRRALQRLISRNANPRDGEAFYNLGLCLRYRVDSYGESSPALARGQMARAAADVLEEAYGAFYKATWNQAWAAAAYHALAEIDCRRKCWETALAHIESALRLDADNLRARNLKTLVLRKLGNTGTRFAEENLRLDPLDWWARHLLNQKPGCDLQTQLDIAHDYARAGFYAEAIDLLNSGLGAYELNGGSKDAKNHGLALPNQSWGAMPLVQFTIGWLEQKRGNEAAAHKHYQRAAELPPDYCFPARLEEIAILESAMRANPGDSRAPFYLGNLLYARRRHVEAIRLWERSARLNGKFSVVRRNLGIGYFNVLKQPGRARAAYQRACANNPGDARLLYERDQLWKRLGESPSRRLKELEKNRRLVEQRDDLSIELCTLYNQSGQHSKALELLTRRKFQPWEGGEGGPLGEHVRACMGLGRTALTEGNPAEALRHFEMALSSPANLGEARHLLANPSEIHYWTGCASAALGQKPAAKEHWRKAAEFEGDFVEMSVRSFSTLTYFSALARERLGQRARARKLLRGLLKYAQRLQKSSAKIDYFATSLPMMLLFDDDMQARQQTTALLLQAQARYGLGEPKKAKVLLARVLKRDPNNGPARDLWTQLNSE